MIAKTNIRDDYFPFIRQDSVASIKKSLGIAGSSYFDISRGQGTPLPRMDASIKCQEQAATVESSIDQIRKEVMPVLEKVRDAVNTYDALGAHLNELIVGIQQGRGTAGKLVSDPAIADNLKSILEKANASMEQVQNTLKEVQTVSTHISSASQSVDRQVQQDLPGLILQIQQTLQEMQTLIKGIEGVWPIRSHIPQHQSNTRIPPSEVVP